MYFETRKAPIVCYYCKKDITYTKENHFCKGKIEAIKNSKFEGNFKGKIIHTVYCTKCAKVIDKFTIYNKVKPGVFHKNVFSECEHKCI